MTIRFATNRKMLILPLNLDSTEHVAVLEKEDSSANRRLTRFAALQRKSGIAMLLGLTFLLAASQSMMFAQRGKKTEQQEEQKPAIAEAGGGVVDPHAYKIGAEDVLSIRVWHEPDLSGTFVVRPDGKITLPLSGEVMAGGLTPVELSKVVKDAYGKLVNNPEVMLQVETVRSKKYFLVGEVNRAGAFSLVVATTILDAINTAGGLREFANAKNIVIVRGEKRIKFNYRDVIRGKNLVQNILVENGDHIVVR